MVHTDRVRQSNKYIKQTQARTHTHNQIPQNIEWLKTLQNWHMHIKDRTNTFPNSKQKDFVSKTKNSAQHKNKQKLKTREKKLKKNFFLFFLLFSLITFSIGFASNLFE